ncbi:hypothetical protein D3C85_1561360 [compost metagenome]
MHLEKGCRANDLAGLEAILAVGRNKGGDDDQAGLVHQSRDFGHPADIFAAILRGEAQVTVKTVAHVVAIEDETGVAHGEQACFQGEGQGGLAGATQPGHPDGCRALTQETATFFTGDMAILPNDILRLHFLSFSTLRTASRR